MLLYALEIRQQLKSLHSFAHKQQTTLEPQLSENKKTSWKMLIKNNRLP